ncbi:MAG: ATP synthase F1 subunit epsilon [Bacteroidales bacterium]|jgi:F-type H+-transporting ATPase subunit epsilon|nr:ATP synthase F1 subunit epsilon [Bacteroidales bacterium]
MKVEIFTPDREIYVGEASLIQLSGIDGLFEILEHHAPMIAALKAGKVKLQDMQEQTHYFDINGGMVEVLHDKVLVLAE